MIRPAAVIFDGGWPGGWDTRGACRILCQKLAERGWSVASFRLAEAEVAPCRGCFACWVKTPGLCIIDDAGRDLVRAAIQADLLAYVTPLTFGGYSHELKKIVDRMIPLILPYFQTVRGEVHHVRRYERYPSLFAVAVREEQDSEEHAGEDEATFATLVRRNAINMHAPRSAACVVAADPDSAALEEGLREVIGT